MAEKKNDTEETVTEAKATKPAAKKAPAKASDAKPAAEKKVTEKKSAEKKVTDKKAASASSESAAPVKATTKPATAAAKKAADAAAELGHGGTLRVHHLRPAPGAKTAKTRVGRGEASKGKTAGRGTKGQKARYQIPERFEGGQMPMHMRLPKLRGFRNPFRVEFQIVNLEKLGSLYPTGGEVTIEDLIAKGAVRKGKPVKVLGTGELSVKLAVSVDAYSESAKEKILAAGGSISQD